MTTTLTSMSENLETKTIKIAKKKYGTQELAKRWNVSSETVRRYLKRYNNNKNESGNYTITQKQLAPLEQSLDMHSYKALIKSNRWEITPFNGDGFFLRSIKQMNHKLYLCLQEEETNNIWDAIFCLENEDKAIRRLYQLLYIKKIYIKGCKNKASNRLVISKLYRKKPF